MVCTASNDQRRENSLGGGLDSISESQRNCKRHCDEVDTWDVIWSGAGVAAHQSVGRIER
jgi:hypothetical protein